MTIKNIVGGFKVCDIYPLDRDAIKVPKIKSIERLSEESGLPFIPMLSPARQEKKSTSDFSAEETKKFKRNDHRYNAWLKKYHSEFLALPDGEKGMTVSFLKLNTPGSVSPDLPSDSCSFSSESLSFGSPRPSCCRSSSYPRVQGRRDASSSSSSSASQSRHVQMLSVRSGSFGSLLVTPFPSSATWSPSKMLWKDTDQPGELEGY